MTDIRHTDSLTEPRPNSHKLFSSKTILWPLYTEEIYLKHGNSIDVIFDLEGLRVDNVNDPERVVPLAQLKNFRGKVFISADLLMEECSTRYSGLSTPEINCSTWMSQSKMFVLNFCCKTTSGIIRVL